MKLSKMTIAAIVIAILFWGFDKVKPYFSGQAEIPASNQTQQK
ncbi:hypothetical protein [Budvicia diplopodorum]|nr:hypothetical protein [Budvicia diplopodorum]